MGVLLAVFVGFAGADDLLTMSTQLDQLDRAELLELLDKADLCVTAHDFPCAQLHLGKARKFANAAKNQADWARVNDRLASTRTQVELARQRAEEEAAHAERLIAADNRREAQRLAQMESDNQQASPNYGAAISDTFNATIQNFKQFNSRMNAQQQAVFRQASEARSRQAEAQRNQQLAAAQQQQRLEGERQRLADERASRERRGNEAAAAEKKMRGDQLLADSERAQRVASEQGAQREREQRAQDTRQRNERAKADRLAVQQAEKAAHEKELADYHAAMAQGIRLVAIDCFGEHSATGTAPELKEPRGGSCIDVNYEATCPDNRQAIRGVAKTFVGMAGCFGDTYKFPSRPGCAIKDVRVRVISVQSCS